jgi:hypothetical protein
MVAPYKRCGEATNLYNSIESIPGYFNYDDAQHFWLILSMQRYLGVAGDILEIGTWKGRSAAYLSFHLSKGERLFLSDVFSAPATDKYPEYPSADDVRRAIVGLNQDSVDSLIFLLGDSRHLVLPDRTSIRFAHVDGGHSFDECYSDLSAVSPFICAGGVIAVDDYDHPDWPEVMTACDSWLEENPAYFVLGDMNRNVAKGRKLYIGKHTSS